MIAYAATTAKPATTSTAYPTCVPTRKMATSTAPGSSLRLPVATSHSWNTNSTKNGTGTYGFQGVRSASRGRVAYTSAIADIASATSARPPRRQANHAVHPTAVAWSSRPPTMIAHGAPPNSPLGTARR